MTKGAGWPVTMNGRVFVARLPRVSRTSTAMPELPAIAGVPTSSPPVDKTMPEGSGAVEAQVYGVLPPNADHWKLYGFPTVAPGSTIVVIVGPLLHHGAASRLNANKNEEIVMSAVLAILAILAVLAVLAVRPFSNIIILQ